MIATAVVSDRGDLYLPECLDQLHGFGLDPFVVDDREHHLGMAGAVQAAWARALSEGCDYLFHVEEDFRFNDPPPLEAMQYVLERAPHLAHIVLKRQPAHTAEEQAAGGIIEAHPGDYTDCSAMRQSARWCEHRRIFSLNPCLIPRRVLEMGWPAGNEAEFTQMCLAADLRFAFYGHRFEAPLVTHVGDVRSAGWRL